MLKNRPEARAAARRVPAGELFSAESSRAQLSVLRGMNALERHRHFLQHCPHLSGSSAAARGAAERSDLDVVQDEHRFLWDRAGEKAPLTWEQRLARRYHEKLFKEYALADMSRHREGQVGLRWRTEAEVFDGKGQFVCGNKRCVESADLTSFELNFAYVEHGERRQALVNSP
jgi:protein FRA10AC1